MVKEVVVPEALSEGGSAVREGRAYVVLFEKKNVNIIFSCRRKR
jgi:hypothetical protein